MDIQELERIFEEVYRDYEFTRQNLLVARSNLKIVLQLVRLKLFEINSITFGLSNEEKNQLQAVYKQLTDSVMARIDTEHEELDFNSSVKGLIHYLEGEKNHCDEITVCLFFV